MPRLLACLLVLALGGCSLAALPSQSNPTCSWESRVPDNADAVCTRTVSALQKMTAAVARGDARTIRRLVVDPVTAGKMILYSQRIRAAGARGLHVVPSIALDQEAHGRIGAGFYVLGTTRRRRIKSQETLYFNWVRGRYVVTASDLEKDW